MSPLPSLDRLRAALAASFAPGRRPLGLACAALLALAACGDDAPGDTGSGGSTATASTSSGADATGATTSATGVASGGGEGGSASTGDGGSSSGEGGSTTSGSGGGDLVFGGDRSVELFVPSGYDGTPMPLVVLLHGYTATGAVQEAYFGVEALAEELGFLYLHPDGTVDGGGENFWNATDACCNFYGSTVDDSAYLRGLVDEVSAELSVDPKRVYFMGHSNGGFMSHRMACDHADVVAAVGSLAGATFADAADCAPSEPVAALQIHGTADGTVAYGGGFFGANAYPGAEETAETWAHLGGCAAAPTAGADRDLSSALAGSESSAQVWEGCDPGGGAELWTIPAGQHVPALSDTFTRQLVEWLLAHPKP